MKIDVMIPAYDEFPNLRILIPSIQKLLINGGPHEIRIHVIHKHDESVEELFNLETLGVSLIRRAPTNSFGAAIRSGIRALPEDSQLTLFMDADGSHDPLTVLRLILIMEDGSVDVGIASRYIEGGTSDNTLLLRAMSRILNSVYGLVLGINARDISTNFKIYRSTQLRNITLECDKFDILEELLMRLNENTGNNLKIIEIPDRFHSRKYGVSKRKLGPFIIGYVLTLFRLRFKSK